MTVKGEYLFKRIIVLSGSISSGKSTLAKGLAEKYCGFIVKTNEYVKGQTKLKDGKYLREDLQKTGDRLDKKTKGKWVIDYIQEEENKLIDQKKSFDLLIIDSVRLEKQIDGIRQAYESKVLHLHLSAKDEVLAQRYSAREAKFEEFSDYGKLRKNKTEKNVKNLSEKADAVITTDKCTKDDVLVRAGAYLRKDQQQRERLVDVLVGGQYGSEGKGNIAAYIAQEYGYLVRVGGPNAGHKVYDDPILTFRHLPSGTVHAQNAHIVLGPGMVIDLDVLIKEIATCQLSHERLSIDPKAVIIHQKDIDYEVKHQGGISSTKKGVGSASARRIQERGEKAEGKGLLRLAKEVPELAHYIRESSEVLERAYNDNASILLEGTQGTSLSLFHGPYPHVTSRDTTVSGCLSEAGISPRRIRKVILVCRTYPIRVEGNSGPMSQEIDWKTISKRSGVGLEELLKTEKTTTTNRERRVAEFDWVQLRESSVLNAPTDIALTFVDYIDIKNKDARRFEQLTTETINFIEEVERIAGAPVSMISTRFHWRNIIDRRTW